MAKKITKATARAIGAFKIECTARDQKFYLDEPVEIGGDNEGMTPVEGLLSVLGGCKCMVAKMFAKAYKINLQDIRIEFEGEIDTDGFTGKNKDAKIGLSKIVSKYYIKADNTPEEIEKFIKVVEQRCPVLDTIVNTPELEYNITIE